MMTFRTLCRGIVPVLEKEEFDFQITGVQSDSRRVESGNVFVAVRGFEADGHDYIDEAVRKGAAAVIAERVENANQVPSVLVADSRKALARLADRFFGEPSKGLRLIGVTGTNGKTTVTFLLESIFRHAGVATGLLGTTLYRWERHEESAGRTTPDALDLHRYLGRMKEDGVHTVVMEVSSHALALHRVFGMTFRAAVFTNLTRDHLDFHASLQDYGDTKARLFGMLSSDGTGVINGDDAASGLMRRASRGKSVLFGEKNAEVDYRIADIVIDINETTFSVVHEKRRMTFSTPLWGRFNVINACAAGVVGLELGLEEDAIREGLRGVRNVRGRMEGFDSQRGYRIVVDYAHTPDALENVLAAAREFTRGRLIVVFGCGGDRDRGKRPEMGRIAASLADIVVVTSDNPRREDPQTIVTEIVKGIASSKNVEMIVDRREAIHRALDAAREGDTVVIAGKGHETYQEVGTERFPFDDRIVAETYLQLKEGL